MLFLIGIVGTVLTAVLLLFAPAWGILAALLSKPIVDTTFDQPAILGLKLTELISGVVPLFILIRAFFATDAERSLRRMPLYPIWLIWSIYAAFFSSLIMYGESVLEGVNVFFRHLNGLAGFYMAQAYFCRDERLTRRFFLCLAIAAIFPVATGTIEALTGHHWRITLGEGNVIRGVGLYHDGITIRYYALQGILALLVLSALYWQRQRLLRVAALVYGLFAALVIQRAYSKSGILTLGSWALLWPLLLRKYKSLAVVAVVAVIGIGWYGAELMDAGGFIFHKEVAALQGTGGVNRTFAGRWYTWQEMMEEWRGFDTLAQLFGAGRVATGAHNDYLQILYHGGMVGLSIYLLLLALIFRRVVLNLLRRIDVFSVAALLALIMWMVDTIGLVPSAYSGYQWFVWGVVGVCFRRRADEERAPIVVSAAGKTDEPDVPGRLQPEATLLQPVSSPEFLQLPAPRTGIERLS